MFIQIPVDGGPIYAETDLTSSIPEPWNALSSLAIIFPAVYWAIRLKGDYQRFPFIFFCAPLLFLGGVGSTLYHAFRSSEWLLFMDVFPTAIVTFCVGAYFWFKILSKWWLVALIMVPITMLRFALFEFIPTAMAVNSGYFLTGVMIFLPILIYLRVSDYQNWRDIFLSFFFLALSLLFRDLDHSLASIIPIGTHFLWHLLSGVGGFYLAKFLYRIRLNELRALSGEPPSE